MRYGREGVARTASRDALLEDFAARGRPPSEQKDPQLAAELCAIVEPHTHADPELKSSRRYTNLSSPRCVTL